MFFFIKISIMIMLITSIKQNILIDNFNFNEKLFIHFKKFNEKDQIAPFFLILGSNWNLKKLENQFDTFE